MRAALQFAQVHLYGHSWGTMLALDYVLTHPARLNSLVLASPCADIPRFARDVRALLAAMPPEIRDAVQRNEAAGTFETEEYQEATFAFYQRHLCRVDPLPEPLQRSMAGLNPQVYGTMWGASEFTISGNLAGYDRTARLGELTLPVLLTCGRFDEVTPAATAEYQSQIPNARMVIFENSAHVAMLEEPEAYVQTLREFLRQVEAG